MRRVRRRLAGDSRMLIADIAQQGAYMRGGDACNANCRYGVIGRRL
jgi:hypothetical protein